MTASEVLPFNALTTLERAALKTILKKGAMNTKQIYHEVSVLVLNDLLKKYESHYEAATTFKETDLIPKLKDGALVHVPSPTIDFPKRAERKIKAIGNDMVQIIALWNSREFDHALVIARKYADIPSYDRVRRLLERLRAEKYIQNRIGEKEILWFIPDDIVKKIKSEPEMLRVLS